MKRMIACVTCFGDPATTQPGEWFKRKTGIAKDDMLCDYCNKIIKKGDNCAAESMGTNGIPYYEWEADYINKET